VSRGRALAYCAAAGIAVALAFPNFEIRSLAWVGMVPWMLAVRGRRPWVAYGYGFVTGLVCFGIVLYWIPATVSNFTRIDPYTAYGLLFLTAAAISALVSYAPCALIVEWLAAAGISRVVAFPIVWVVFEWSRNFVVAAFPWAALGYSQYDLFPVNQLAELTGVYGISALLVFTNATLVEVLVGGWRRHLRLLVAAAASIALVCAFGGLRLATLAGHGRAAALRVGLIQGNIPQQLKWDPDLQDKTIDSYIELSRRAIAQGAKLVVWPEAAVPFLLRRDERRSRLTNFADRNGIDLLVGAPGYEKRGAGVAKSYNQAWLIVPGKGLTEFYDKIQLVPFGEYIPLSFLFGSVDIAVESVGDFGRGDRYTIFSGPPARTAGKPTLFGTLICYEGIFPSLSRRLVARGARLLVNISNDAWYGSTSAPYQHLSMVTMRAIENRVPVVRATNTGITALIDATGRVRKATSLFVPAVVVDDVRLSPARGLYTRVGDSFVALCLLAFALLVFFRFRLRSQSRA